MTDNNYTTAELEAMLAQARQAEDAARREQREATPIIWKFTISPSDRSYDELYDETIRLYLLKGEVVNQEEASAAGHPEHAMRGGGMVYAYNSVTESIIIAVGGGTIFVSGHSWGKEDTYHAAKEAMKRIGWFLSKHPEGGDITDIVLEYRKKVGL